jgi:hypothetical protein
MLLATGLKILYQNPRNLAENATLDELSILLPALISNFSKFHEVRPFPD